MKFLVLFPALIHVYIFLLESFLWGKPSTNKSFGLRPADVEATRSFAFNLGVYNLMLGIAVIAGAFLWMGIPSFDKGPFAGQVLLVYGLGSITVAALTLLASSPQRWKAALIQGLPAVLGLVVVFTVN